MVSSRPSQLDHIPLAQELTDENNTKKTVYFPPFYCLAQFYWAQQRMPKLMSISALEILFLSPFLSCLSRLMAPGTSIGPHHAIMVMVVLGSSGGIMIHLRSGTENLDKPLSGISATTKAH